MARRLDKERVLKMRIEKEMSYSEIKAVTGISKATLSSWLAPYPLSKERIKSLGPMSDRRIENCRNTKRKNREKKNIELYNRVLNDIGTLSDRELFIAGLFLYWGEGGKTTRLSFSNTDPGMIMFYIKWLERLGVTKNKIRIRLDLYSDMNIDKEVLYWSNVTNIYPDRVKVNIKNSTLTNLTYKNGFGHGTCRIEVGRRDILDYVFQALAYIRNSL